MKTAVICLCVCVAIVFSAIGYFAGSYFEKDKMAGDFARRYDELRQLENEVDELSKENHRLAIQVIMLQNEVGRNKR